MSDVQNIRKTAADIRKEAEQEVAVEQQKKGKEALKVKLRQLETAKAVVSNLEREIDDLVVAIDDGSF